MQEPVIVKSHFLPWLFVALMRETSHAFWNLLRSYTSISRLRWITSLNSNIWSWTFVHFSQLIINTKNVRKCSMNELRSYDEFCVHFCNVFFSFFVFSLPADLWDVLKMKSLTLHTVAARDNRHVRGHFMNFRFFDNNSLIPLVYSSGTDENALATEDFNTKP